MRAVRIAIGLACAAACGPSINMPPRTGDAGDAHAGDGEVREAGVSDGGDGSAVADGGASRDALASGDARAEGAAAAGGSISDGSAGESSSVAPGFLRLANWSPDTPGIDFCLAPHGSTGFTGPIVGGIDTTTGTSTSGLTLSSGDAGPSSSVSAYVAVGPGKYDVRIIVAGGTCSVGVVPDFTSSSAITSNTYSTIALIGEQAPMGGDPALQAVSFTDDYQSSGTVALRFVNASPALTAGADLNVSVKPAFLFHGVQFGHTSSMDNVRLAQADAGSPPAVDSNGYAAVSLSNTGLTGQPSSAAGAVVVPPVKTAMGVSAAANSVITVVLVGGTSTLSPPARRLECVDNAGTAGALSDCTILR